jgi:hypothetical protein
LPLVRVHDRIGCRKTLLHRPAEHRRLTGADPIHYDGAVLFRNRIKSAGDRALIDRL